MNEKPWKMEANAPNWLSSLWFNSRLFTFNEFPLKFYLVGYNPCEAYEIMKIIEAYGGQFSSPDDPDALLFCDPEYPVDTGERDLYNIKYFHDSIAGLKPQELILYKIHGSIDEQLMDVDDSWSSKNEETIKFSNSIDFHHQITADEELKTCDEEIYERDEINFKEADDSWTAARAKVYCRERKSFVDDLMGNSHGVKAGPPADCPGDDCSDDGTRCESLSEDDDESDDSGVSKMTDDTVYLESAIDNNSSVGNHFSGGARRSAGGRRKKCVFTEEQNEKIVKWIIEKQFIPTDTGKKIWTDFLKEQILPNIDCTPRILARHYSNNLKNLPVMKKYLETAEASRQSIKYSGPRYTEEENRVLIQYLIDKDVIYRARGHSVWKECLAERGELLNPNRSSTSLWNYFKQRLRKQYAKYTDDPKALKQFKSIETTKKPRSQY